MGSQEIVFEKIKNDFQLLSRMVMKQLAYNKQLLHEGNDQNITSEMEVNEGIIDSLEVKLRSEVISSIVLYAPRAIDLRKIIAYYDMTAYMERIGDHLLNVSQQLTPIDRKGRIYTPIATSLQKLFNIVELMTQNAIFAFACEDNLLAKKTIEDDDRADLLHAQIMDALAATSEGVALTKKELSDLLQIGVLAANLERIGDNATNIAESAIYIIEGRDIKHHG